MPIQTGLSSSNVFVRNFHFILIFDKAGNGESKQSRNRKIAEDQPEDLQTIALYEMP
jgi:hypothetical protein